LKISMQRSRSSRFFHRNIVIVENVISCGCPLFVGFITLNFDAAELIIEEVYWTFNFEKLVIIRLRMLL